LERRSVHPTKDTPKKSCKKSEGLRS
jgi:hypothetical protein